MTALVKTMAITVLCTLAIGMAGCQSHTHASAPMNNSEIVNVVGGTAAGAVVGAIAGAATSGISTPATVAAGAAVGGTLAFLNPPLDKRTLRQRLAAEHVQVIQVGEDTMLVLPSNIFFYPNSSHLNENYFFALDDVAKFIGQYETENIKVAGYTNKSNSNLRDIALSRQQAQNIAHYIQKRDLDARFMYSIGYGAQYPIATNCTDEGQNTNRRVQITFRKVTV